MGKRLIDNGVERVYEAAQTWVDRALRSDSSLFTPDRSIWTSQWLGELHQRFLGGTDDVKAGFLDKLQLQLENSPPEVYQLMGEALYFHYLINRNTTVATKQDRINRVLGWSRAPVEIPLELIAGLTPGILNPGPFFATALPFQVGFLIELAEQWKEKTSAEQQRLLEHPWEFQDFAMQLNLRSELFQGHYNHPRPQKAALLHLVFPDIFEAIVSASHKDSIAKAFSKFVKTPEEDVDRQLHQIRPALESQYESCDHFFYQCEIRVQWDPKYKPENCPGPPPPPVDPWAPSSIEVLTRDLLWKPDHLQKIIDGLKDKRQAIFQGPPGTGKTYVAKCIAEWSREHGGDFQIVQFHPSYSYEDFVEGFRPTLSAAGHAGFNLTKGPLRRIAEKAEANPDSTFILVIDEINRGNVAKVLGELYFLLEYRNERVALQYSGEEFSLPENLWFIGTMNTTDRSIALVDAALRRRFYFFGFFPDEPPVQGLLGRWLEENDPEAQWVSELVDSANRKLADRHLGIGPSHFMKKDLPLDEKRVQFIWEQAVIPYIEEQCFGNEEKLKEFAYGRLMQELDSASPGPDAGSGRAEDDGAGDASD